MGTPRYPHRLIPRDLFRIFVVNSLVGLGLLGFMLLFGLRSDNLGRWLLANQIYAHCIGYCTGLVAPRVGVRVSGLPSWRKWTVYCLVLVVTSAFGALLATLITSAIGFTKWQYLLEHLRFSLLIAITAALVLGVVIFLLESLKARVDETTLQLRTQQLENERALKLAAEAQLSSLQSRLQPHFLFNTINSVISLIREDPQAAEVMLQRLARLLRYALDTQHRPLAPLQEELALVRDYLEVERTRFGGRLRYELDVPEGLDSAELPPFSIQTLVENAAKFAVAPRREGGSISVRVRSTSEGLQIEVRDDGPGFTREALTPGHGLDTLEQRLAALFSGAARMEIVESDSGGCVRLRLPAGVAA
jgi:sensor histidine kinase YesM